MPTQGSIRPTARPAVEGATDLEAGFAAVEFVVLFPFVLLTTLVLIQLALWGHVRATAIAGAQDAAEQLAVRPNDAEHRLAIVTETLATHGLDRLSRLDVDTTATVADDGAADSFVVEIDGELTAIIPLFTLPIRTTASATAERFRP